MKKLFFTALVAVVAVGGAFASNSNVLATKIVYTQSGTAILCSNISGPACFAGKLYTDQTITIEETEFIYRP